MPAPFAPSRQSSARDPRRTRRRRRPSPSTSAQPPVPPVVLRPAARSRAWYTSSRLRIVSTSSSTRWISAASGWSSQCPPSSAAPPARLYARWHTGHSSRVDSRVDHLLRRRREFSTRVERRARAGEHRVERLGLRHRARKAVEDEPARSVRLSQPLLDDADHDVVGHQQPGVHPLLRAVEPERRPVLHRLAQDLAGRDLRDAEASRASRRPCVPLPAPGARAAPAASLRRLPAAPDPALLHEPLVVPHQQVRLDLLQRVERHADHDQDAGAAEVRTAG